MTHSLARQPIPVVVQQHAEESAMLRQVRSVLVRAPHVKLHQLGRLDDRIAAHLDGLAVAGAYGTSLCTAALERCGVGEVFALAVRLIDQHDDAALDRLIALAATLPEAHRGLLSAFGWTSAPQLQGIVRPLLTAADPSRRALGIAACRLHGADPGTVLFSALRDREHPALRAAAWRAAGELGRTDALPEALDATADAAPGVACAAAVCACLLGDRTLGLTTLESLAQADGPLRDAASRDLLLATDFHRGREIVRKMAQAEPRDVALKRRVIRACGLLGDAQFVPWLIEMMNDDLLARIAGESFSMISGADLALLDLERKPPDGAQAGPSDDPLDDDVAMDEDDSLPWPERDRVHGWWQRHAAGMPADARCFIGASPTPAHCTNVLRTGAQRQRIIASRLLCLLSPGSTLFPVCAPAWRQQRRLAVP
ncbi:MAG TPA: TIGR02270 family protein [Albitalea sp.]|nr:TIGR02270 family protein [Albitalea sp.]